MHFTFVLVCCLVFFQSSWQVDALAGEDCKEDTDCEDYEICIYDQGTSSFRCGDQRPLCSEPELQCGAHALCFAANHTVSCLCEPGFAEDRDHNCVKECHSSQDCPGNLACMSRLCQDVCRGLTCGKHAVCKTKNHFPTCECFPGYTRADPADLTSDCHEEDTTEHIVETRGAFIWKKSPEKAMSLTLRTHYEALRLLRLKCGGADKGTYSYAVTVERQDKFEPKTYYSQQVDGTVYSNYFYLQLSSCGKGISLSPHAQYKITVSCDREFWVTVHNTSSILRKHFTIYLPEIGAQYLNPVANVIYSVTPASSNLAYMESAPQTFMVTSGTSAWKSARTQSFLLKTRTFDLEIMNLVCFGVDQGTFGYTVRIEHVNSTNPMTLTHRVNTDTNGLWVNIPISRSEKGVILHSNTEYKITVSCDRDFGVFELETPVIKGEDVILTLPKDGKVFLSPVYYISYKRLTTVN